MPTTTQQKLNTAAHSNSADLLSELVVPAASQPGTLSSIAPTHRAAEALATLPVELRNVIDAKYLNNRNASDSRLAEKLGLTTEEFQANHHAALRQLMRGATKEHK